MWFGEIKKYLIRIEELHEWISNLLKELFPITHCFSGHICYMHEAWLYFHALILACLSYMNPLGETNFKFNIGTTKGISQT